MKSKVTNEELMTGYETRLFRGWEKTAADSLKDKKMLEVTMKRALGHEVEETLPTGEKVNVPVIDLLIMKKIGYDLQHPDKIDLKVYSTVLGETKQEVEINTETASEVFKGIVAQGEQPNGSNTRGSKSSNRKV